MDITFETDGNNESSVFNFRAAGLIVRDGKLLLIKDEGMEHWYLPGGRVRMFETSGQAVRRELKEELGIEVSGLELALVNENFFTLNGKKVHELGFFFRITTDPDKLPEEDSFEMDDSDGVRHYFKFASVTGIRDEFLYPVSLKEHIGEILDSCGASILADSELYEK